MTELKTQRNDGNVQHFINEIADDKRRRDAQTVLDLMRELTGEEPAMWGSSIVGFGAYRYEYKSGRKSEWFKVGFSPRKQNLTLYIMNGFQRYDELMARLGKHKTGVSCLYINKLTDVDMDVLRELVRESFGYMTEKYG